MMDKSLKEKLTSLKLPRNIPRILTQEDAVRQNMKYIKDRSNGTITTLKTCYNRLNKALGEIEANTIMTLSGLSGGGKSTLSKRVVNSIIKNLQQNGEKCLSLSFNFEMLAQKTIGREIANLSKLSLQELYSSDNPLSSPLMEKIFQKFHKTLIDYPILYIEEPQDYKTIEETIYYFWSKLCKDSKSYMIVEVDHAVITKGRSGDSQKEQG